MTRVKICGLSEPAHAVAAARAGADCIGLVLAPSPRRVTPERGVEIARAVRAQDVGTQLVGVFVNDDARTVNRLAAEIGLDRVQLSGDEDAAICAAIEKPLIRVIRVSASDTAASVAGRLAAAAGALVGKDVLWLLDTAAAGVYGGSGVSFDPTAAITAARRAPVILAGGLNPQNVARAVRKLNPYGVDVSSGVETDGRKDIAKIRAFVRAVRQADAT